MGVKLLHHTIRVRGGYLSDRSLNDVVDECKAQLFVIDVCAMMMFLLKSERFACRLLKNKICEKGNVYLLFS